MNRLVAAVVLGCAGCSTTSPDGWGAGGGGDSRCHDTERGNFQRGNVEMTRNSRTYLVMLISGGESSKVTPGSQGWGTIQVAGGRLIRWTCDTPEGVHGKVVIDGQPFKLEDGQVFLVDVRNPKTYVEQITVPPGLLEQGSNPDLLKADERVARFLERTDSPR